MKRQSLLALILGACLFGEPQAAEISFQGIVRDDPFDIATFRVEGEIAEGDVEKAMAAMEKADLLNKRDDWNKLVVSLNGDEGSFGEAVDLALFFRKRGMATIVRKGDRCLSACAIAFLGGTSDPDPNFPDGAALPGRPPDRTLEPGAELAFSPPPIDGAASAPEANAAVYSSGLADLARILDVADDLHLSADAIAPLLEATEAMPYRIDTVDAVRSLGIRYWAENLILNRLPGLTRSMIMNVCINRYHHLRQQRSRPGFSRVASIMKEFIEGSKLLKNGEEKRVFGYRQDVLLGRKWLAYMPVNRTEDEKAFVWCLYEGDRLNSRVYFKAAGTIEELFTDFSQADPGFVFARDGNALPIGSGGDERTWMSLLDVAPPETKLADVRSRVDAYLAKEKLVPFPE